MNNILPLLPEPKSKSMKLLFFIEDRLTEVTGIFYSCVGFSLLLILDSWEGGGGCCFWVDFVFLLFCIYSTYTKYTFPESSSNEEYIEN